MRCARWLVVLGMLLASASARGDGFQLERFEPAAPGNWFFSVEHPWYSSTRWAAAGLVLDYGHDPLLGGRYEVDGHFVQQVAIVEHQIVGHVSVAGSFLDRVQVQASLPVVISESGTPAFGVRDASGAAVGDPRLGAIVRLLGHADRDPISLHLAAWLWIPVGNEAQLASDPGVRGRPEVILAGFALGHLRWSLGVGVLARGTTRLGFGPASSIGSELQVRAGVAWADTEQRFHVGPEATITTALTGDDALTRSASSIELLLGAQYNLARTIQLGLAVGSAVMPTLGSPDARVIASIAWAPMHSRKPPDADQDGIPDAEDACPKLAGASSSRRDANGCPVARDPDGDGVPQAEDVCPDEAAGAHPDPDRKGCPSRDPDDDGVPQAEDLCPDEPAGAHPDPGRKGCPSQDVDGDGVPEAEDVCPDLPAGAHPDPSRKGCPAKDSDGDGVPDLEDACPKLAGVADPDPRKNGCPAMSAASRTELKSVHFDTNEAQLTDESMPVLDEAARLLVAHPEVKHVVIEGHADDTGTHEWNLRLSRKRAEAVVKYLEEKGVPARRLKAVGYGDTRPLSSDRSDEARAKNRRVEMLVPAEK